MSLTRRRQHILCPGCGSVAEHHYFFICGTGAEPPSVLWSDGKWEQFWPSPPEIAQCAKCGDYYWISKAKKIPNAPLNWKFWERKQVVGLGNLSAAQYLEALDKGIATSAKEERLLRVQAWWTENDQYRHLAKSGETIPNPTFTKAGIENLLRLSEIQDTSKPTEVLTKAEIARELGKMEQAEKLLSYDFPAKCEHYAMQMRRWLQAGERGIHRFILLDASGIMSLTS